MIDLTEYMTLPVNSKHALECCKRGKKTAVIFADSDKLTFYCARCGETYSRKRAGGLRKVWDGIVPTALAQPKTVSPVPPDFTSGGGTVFGYGVNGFHSSCIARVVCGYSSMYNRLVLPIYPIGTSWPIDRQPIGAQLRALDGKQPKYFTVGTNWYGTAPSPRLYTSMIKTVVFTEDILSSFHVTESMPSVQGLALLGTSANIDNLLHIVTHFVHENRDCKFVVWLDGDEAGRSKSLVVMRQLDLLGVQPRRIVTDLDPKMYTAEKIRSLLIRS